MAPNKKDVKCVLANLMICDAILGVKIRFGHFTSKNIYYHTLSQCNILRYRSLDILQYPGLPIKRVKLQFSNSTSLDIANYHSVR